MITKNVFWVWMSCSCLCLSSVTYADWDDNGGTSQEVLKERAAQEFIAQDQIMQRSPRQHSQAMYPVYHRKNRTNRVVSESSDNDVYSSGLPSHISTHEKVIIVDPNVHAWGAYANGTLIRSGLATAGSTWCSDIGRPCKTKTGVFRVYSLGGEDCVSSIYPIEEGGGAPMPYCMYFNGSQGLHGSDHVVRGNISHGCVRMRVGDAEWLRYNFVNIGTKVIVRPY
jgi:lipoprotein-anchoring transpeptidase ErfK/SrfK